MGCAGTGGAQELGSQAYASYPGNLSRSAFLETIEQTLNVQDSAYSYYIVIAFCH